jgi:hypothetical protein
MPGKPVTQTLGETKRRNAACTHETVMISNTAKKLAMSATIASSMLIKNAEKSNPRRNESSLMPPSRPAVAWKHRSRSISTASPLVAAAIMMSEVAVSNATRRSTMFQNSK